MEGTNQNLLMIRVELMTIQEIIQVATKVIKGEDLGFMPDMNELKWALMSCDERFEYIEEYLSKLEDELSRYEEMIEYD